MFMINTFPYKGEWKRWRGIFFVVAVPAIILGHVSAFQPMFFPTEGQDPHARPDFVAYDYLRVRSKVSKVFCRIRVDMRVDYKNLEEN